MHGKWGFSELFGGCDNPLPLPLGEVPQCAHWGGEGNYAPAKQAQDTLSVKNRFQRADFCQLSQGESQERLRRKQSDKLKFEYAFLELHGDMQLLFLFDPWMKGRRNKPMDKADTLKNRIRSGKLKREDVARRLAELAFGRANDCVKLVLQEDAQLGKLDLSLLSEVRRSEKGAVEVRLVDRLKALEQLAQLAEGDGSDLESFLKALQGGEDGT